MPLPADAPGPRICIVSGGSHVRFLSYLNHRAFALEHNLYHRLEISLGTGIRSPYWHKFVAIENVLPEFDWILWIDDDAFFTRWNENSILTLIQEAERADKFFVVSEGPVEEGGVWSRINTGVMLVRNDPRSWKLLTESRAIDLGTVRDWWSDERDGIFTTGDQDAIWWTLRNYQELNDGHTIVGHRLLNSRPQHYGASLADATIVHFPGPGDKDLRIANFGHRFGMGQSLVPAQLLKKYSIRTPERMSETEKLRRRVHEQNRRVKRRVRIKLNWLRDGRRRD